MNQVEFSEWPVAKSDSVGSPLKVGVVRLNHPKALNSLTLVMVEACSERLLKWEADPEIVAVVFYSDLEKAFCAGGDVKSVVQNLNAGDPDGYASRFFRYEYKMDYTLQTYKKPVLTWGDGIVMGGGMGLFCGSSHRVVTERSILAMPEISIGFFPDVGAGFFLNQLPRPIALFLAWTAARLNATDALSLKLATHLLSSGSRTDLFSQVRELKWTQNADENHKLLDVALDRLSLTPDSHSDLKAALPELEDVFGNAADARKLAEKFLSANFKSDWLRLGQETFKAGSPTSALVAFEQLQRASQLSILDVFVMEWTLARHMCSRNDFREGVRARLIDKDNSPNWKPNAIDAVTSEAVMEHFVPYQNGSESEAEIRQFFSDRQSWT